MHNQKKNILRDLFICTDARYFSCFRNPCISSDVEEISLDNKETKKKGFVSSRHSL